MVLKKEVVLFGKLTLIIQTNRAEFIKYLEDNIVGEVVSKKESLPKYYFICAVENNTTRELPKGFKYYELPNISFVSADTFVLHLNSVDDYHILLSYFIQWIVMIASKHGIISLHGAAINFQGRNILIFGKSGSGKTSFVNTMKTSFGAEVLADDIIFVSAENGRYICHRVFWGINIVNKRRDAVYERMEYKKRILEINKSSLQLQYTPQYMVCNRRNMNKGIECYVLKDSEFAELFIEKWPGCYYDYLSKESLQECCEYLTKELPMIVLKGDVSPFKTVDTFVSWMEQNGYF